MARANTSKGLKGRKLSADHIRNRTAAVRAASSWKHDDGHKCKCVECKARRAQYMRERRRKRREKYGCQ